MIEAFPDDADQKSGFDHAQWIDLIHPTHAEIESIRDRFGLEIPTRDDLEKIEASSRLNVRDDVLFMSAPLISGTETGHWEVAPVGFLLTKRALITIRFAKLEAFETVRAKLDAADHLDPSDIFTRLLEEIVDRAADHLERASQTINETSRSIFFDPVPGRTVGHDTSKLRSVMRQIGQVSDRVARTRYAFLSVGRMADFALDRCSPTLAGGVRERLDGVRRDIHSLDEFEGSLSNRIQFLQDSAVGFISIEQNDVVKLLTVVSVVGVPPVLVVGIYGMNFKHMPELSWKLGYPFALALCLLSALVPLAWFKWRDWI